MEKPLYLIEEHHEAFLVWHHAGIRENRPAELIHVDSHPDMSLLCAGKIPGPDACLEEIADFVHNRLDIQTFITPAVFNGWFNQVTWVKPDIQKPAGSNTWIWKTKGEEDRLFMGKEIPESGVGKKFFYQWTGIDHADRSETGYTPSCRPKNSRTVLDIDLDFFKSSTGPYPGTIEITEDEYKRYVNDPRHYLRLHFGSRARVEEKNSRYFLTLTPEDMVHRAGIRTVETEAAALTIRTFGAWLTRNRINPDLISICRSRISGFTPKGLWESLEQALINLLTSIYGRLCIFDPNSLFENHTKNIDFLLKPDNVAQTNTGPFIIKDLK